MVPEKQSLIQAHELVLIVVAVVLIAAARHQQAGPLQVSRDALPVNLSPDSTLSGLAIENAWVQQLSIGRILCDDQCSEIAKLNF